MKKQYNLLGIMLAVLATILFATMDSLAKKLVQDYSVANVTCIRYVIQLVIIIIIFGPFFGKTLCTTNRLKTQIIRGTLNVGISLSFFASLQYLPLAEATAITFLSPILTIILALLLLKERIKKRLWIAVTFGVIGVIAIVKPGGALFSLAVFLPIITAILYSLYEIATKKISGVESPFTSLLYSTLVGAFVSGLILPFTWQAPTSEQVILLILLAIVGLLAHFSLIFALEYTTLSSIQPYYFLQLIWSSVAGFLAFDETLDAFSSLGIMIIAASGLLAIDRKH